MFCSMLAVHLCQPARSIISASHVTCKNTTIFLSGSSGASGATGSSNDRVFTLLGRSQSLTLMPLSKPFVEDRTCSTLPFIFLLHHSTYTGTVLQHLFWAFICLSSFFFLRKHIGTGGVGKSTIMKQMIRTLVSSSVYSSKWFFCFCVYKAQTRVFPPKRKTFVEL